MNEVYYAGSLKGEKCIPLNYGGKYHPNISVDLYIPLEVRKKVEPEATKPLIVEYNGCPWHGCPKCFRHTDSLSIGGVRMDKLYWETLDRAHALERLGNEVQVLWEHDLKKMLKDENSSLYQIHNKHAKGELKRRFDLMPDISGIIPRHAFFGGMIQIYF